MDESVKLEAQFLAERETKNTIRYQKEVESHPLIGVLYVQKGAIALLGSPPRIRVTIEAAQE